MMNKNTFAKYQIIPGLNNTNQSIDVDFKIKTEKYSVFFRSNQAVLSGNAESFLASALLPCMSSGGGNLHIEGEVSERFISNLSIIQNIYSSWNPSFERLKIENAKIIKRKPSSSKRVGLFFSGGVDSFNSLIKYQNEITDIIFVHGLDIKLKHNSYRKRISKSIQDIATHFGKNLIEIETNLRDLIDSFIQYGLWGWSISLPVIGHLLSPHLKYIYLSENRIYKNISPAGSLLLPLWFTESFDLISEGHEMSRLEKVSIISENDFIMQNLRVCHKTPKTNLNCGNCEKCLRTMISLKANNALDRCTTFEKDIDIKSVQKIRLRKKLTYGFHEQNLKLLQDNNGDKKLISALKKVVNRPIWLNSFHKKIYKITRKKKAY